MEQYPCLIGNSSLSKLLSCYVERNISVVQTSCEVLAASYQMSTGALSPWVKRPGPEDDHSSPCYAELKNGGAILPLPHTSS
jgi:hypothetical protein